MARRKLTVLFWHMLTREQDYAFGRPAMTRNKIRQLELRAGAPPQKGRHGIAGGKSKVVTLVLSKDARKLLAKRGSLKVSTVVNATDAAGNARTTTKAMTIRRATH